MPYHHRGWGELDRSTSVLALSPCGVPRASSRIGVREEPRPSITRAGGASSSVCAAASPMIAADVSRHPAYISDGARPTEKRAAVGRAANPRRQAAPRGKAVATPLRGARTRRRAPSSVDMTVDSQPGTDMIGFIVHGWGCGWRLRGGANGMAWSAAGPEGESRPTRQPRAKEGLHL
jgi:hypothetical protein